MSWVGRFDFLDPPMYEAPPLVNDRVDDNGIRTEPPVWKILAALGAVYLIWGSTYFAMRVAIVGIPPLLMASSRYLLAGAALYTLLRARGTPAPTRQEWLSALPVGLLLPALGNGSVAFAQQWVASSVAAVLIGAMPLFAALFGSLFGVRPGKKELLGVALGTVGILLLNLDGSLRAHPLGALLLLIAPIAWAFGSVWSRRLPLPAGPMSSALQMLWGSVFLGVTSALHHDVIPTQIAAGPAFAFLYLVIAGSMIAYSAYGYLLRTVRPALATSYAYVNPLVALLLGWTLGKERLGTLGLAGTAVIITAVVLVASGSKKR